MSKFLRPVKQKLKNAQHFSLIEAFVTVLQEAGFTGAKIEQLTAVLIACFGEENRCYMQARASEIIRRRDEADKQRDKFYTKLYALVRIWLNSGNAPLESAAEEIVKVFRLYKVNTQAQIDEQTGQMDNLIDDLSTPEMFDRIETIGGIWLFQQMGSANESVKALRLEQGMEVSEKVAGALEKARKATDEAYDNVIAMIEALSLTADDPTAYEAFINRWNGTLKIYQDMLDRKSSSGSSPSTDNPSQGGSTPTPSPEPGGDTPGGDTPGGSGGDEPGGDTPGGDQPGGDEPGGDTPDGDTPGGEEPGGDTPGGETPGGDSGGDGGGTGPDGLDKD